MHAITDFGSPALLGPIALLMALRLWVRSGPRQALYWLLALGAGTGVTALFKVYFSACGLAPAHIHSPSGHACFSVLVYGGLMVFGWAAASWRRRTALLVLGVPWIGLIGWSRVAIGAHTSSEVVSGTVIGALALSAFAVVYLRSKPPRASLILPVTIALLVIVPLHGRQVAIEPLLQRIGAWLHHAVPICVGA